MALRDTITAQFNEGSPYINPMEAMLRRADNFMAERAPNLKARLEEMARTGALVEAQISGDLKARFHDSSFSFVNNRMQLFATEGFKALAVACAHPDIDAQLEITGGDANSSSLARIEINISKPHSASTYLRDAAEIAAHVRTTAGLPDLKYVSAQKLSPTPVPEPFTR